MELLISSSCCWLSAHAVAVGSPLSSPPPPISIPKRPTLGVHFISGYAVVRDTTLNYYDKQNGEVPGSLPYGCLTWVMAETSREGPWSFRADRAEEVVGEHTRLGSCKGVRIAHRRPLVASRIENGQEQKATLSSGLAGRHVGANLGEECAREQLKEDLDQLGRRGIRIDCATFASLLRRCGSAKALTEGRRVHSHILRTRYDRDRYLGNLIVRMYGDCGSLEDARAVFDNMPQRNMYSWNIMIVVYAQNGKLEHARSIFDQMPQRDVVSWNTVISAYARSGFAKEAYVLFQQMQLERVKPNKITFLNVIDACSSLATPSEGKEIHSSITESEFCSDVAVATALVNMYGKFGCLDDARGVFDMIRQRDVISWTAMIAAYANNGRGKEALELFRQMQIEGVKPNKVTFKILVDACANLLGLPDGKEIHASILDCGFQSDTVVGNALINMYIKCGSLADARRASDLINQRDVISWNAMIAAHARTGNGKEALDLFQQMQLEGVKPNRITFINSLDACSKSVAVAQGREIHARIIDSGFELDVVLGTALLNMYSKCGNLDDARSMFDKMREHGVALFTAMVEAYSANGQGREALQLFWEMQLEGIEPSKNTFISILDACSSLAALADGKEIHASIIDKGLESDVVVGTALINMYGKCRSLNDARNVFNHLCQRDVISWTAMIGVYAQNGHGKDALELFRQMQLEGLKPDRITFISVLDACAGLASPVECKEIHDAIVGSGIELDSVGTALINMYGKCGNLNDARSTFDKINQPNLFLWTAMITAYAQNDHGKEALQLFQQMLLEGLKPDKITFISILDACAGLASLAEGREIHAIIVDSGFDYDVAVGTSLVNMYGKCGCLDDARSVFDKLHQLDVVLWTAMIAAHAQNGDAENAFVLFEEMQAKGMKPNEITFISVLSACSHTGLLDDGCRYFLSMTRDHSITPALDHYGCMIDLLGRAGQLDEAENLMNNMPFEPDAVTWMNFLGACRVHGNVELGARAAEHVFKLDPNNAAPYILLSNLYATANRWDDVAKVRKTMKDRGVMKKPGCSCIEVKDRVHKFVAGDRSHPQKEEIYAELQRLSGQMKKSGYVPDTNSVLQDVEIEKKANVLCYHSEKLAIAFGLISTPPGTPIRVIKNLRVCSDCHAATKCISKIVQRKITVRDATRFHHFEHGRCSCADYW